MGKFLGVHVDAWIYMVKEITKRCIEYVRWFLRWDEKRKNHTNDY